MGVKSVKKKKINISFEDRLYQLRTLEGKTKRELLKEADIFMDSFDPDDNNIELTCREKFLQELWMSNIDLF